VIEKEDSQLVLNINSLPDEDRINSIRMVRGKRPENADEAVVNESIDYITKFCYIKMYKYIHFKSFIGFRSFKVKLVWSEIKRTV